MALAGLYAYSLQGWMQARNISPDTDGKGDAGTTINPGGINPGWGDPNPVKWWSQRWRYEGEPLGSPPRAILPHLNPLLAVTIANRNPQLWPEHFGPIESPVEGGYYPFSELGVWYFQGADMSGWTSINNAGLTGDTGIPFTRVLGRYQQNTNPNGGIDPMPNGAISTWLPDASKTGNHFWDYFFVSISDIEAQIIVADRLPRPATGCGTLRQISTKMPDYINWPVQGP